MALHGRQRLQGHGTSLRYVVVIIIIFIIVAVLFVSFHTAVSIIYSRDAIFLCIPSSIELPSRLLVTTFPLGVAFVSRLRNDVFL